MALESLGNNIFLFTAKAPEQLYNRNQRRSSSDKIITFGTDNNYPQELIRAVMSSPIAMGCLETHAKYIYGDGFIYPETPFGEALKKYFTNNFLSRISYDMAYSGAFSFSIRYNLNKEIIGFNHVDFSTVRLGELNEEDQITFAMLSPDWEERRKKENKPKKIDLYDDVRINQVLARLSVPDQIENFKSWTGALMYAKRYKPGETYYPRPKYASALSWIYTDGQIQQFHANNVDNAFMPSVIIYIPQEITGTKDEVETKKTALRKKVEDELAGVKNGGEAMLLYGRDKDSAPQIIPFTANTNHELFITLSNLIRDHITSAFQVPPILAGIQVAGKLGASNEIENSIEMYYNGVIRHDVAFILETLNAFVKKLPGYKTEDDLLQISNSTPFNFIDPAFKDDYTEDERRASKGYGPKEVIAPTVPIQEGGTNV